MVLMKYRYRQIATNERCRIMSGSCLNAKVVKRVMFVISNITFGICLDVDVVQLKIA